jgi:hypothetical protein
MGCCFVVRTILIHTGSYFREPFFVSNGLSIDPELAPRIESAVFSVVKAHVAAAADAPAVGAAITQ